VDAGNDAPDIGQPSSTYPAPHADPPQVQDYGGPVLASPKIVPVFFSNDDATMVSALKDFVSKVGGTKYWEAATAEYGIGAATASTPIDLTEMAPATIDDTAIQTWLLGKLNGNDPAWPANDGNTVYVLHYPSTTTITLGNQASCQAFGGYHSNTTLDAAHGSADVAYAVVPRCSNFAGMSTQDATTGSESHELIEAVTDPYPQTNPAYATIDTAHAYWQRVLGGGEVGDMCAQFPQAFVKFPELPLYTVQRTWSNKAAKAGHDPCQPIFPGEGAYFNASPDLQDTISVTFMGMPVTYKGVEIPLGQSKTIDLDLFSDGPANPWTVEAKDLASLLNPMAPPALGLSLDATQGQNGQKLHLTITVMTAGKRGTETFLIVNKDANGNENWWIGVVGTPVADGGAPHDGGGPG
jgi:hypothetical protein